MNQGRIIVITGAPGTGKTQRHLLLQKNQIWKSLCICTQMTFIII